MLSLFMSEDQIRKQGRAGETKQSVLKVLQDLGGFISWQQRRQADV